MTRTHKYNAVRVKADGYTFDSKQEYKRYCELKLMEKAGIIWRLKVHPKFDISIKGEHFCYYTGDFDYFLTDNSEYVLEDVKAIATTAYKLQKKALFLDKGIKITEVNVKRKKKNEAKIKANNIR